MEASRYPGGVVERIMLRRGGLHAFECLEPRRTALLVVDMQNAFLGKGGAGDIPAAHAIVPTINRLARAVRERGGHVVWVVSTYGPEAADYWPTLFDHVLGPEYGQRFRDGLTEGAQGHAIWEALEVGPGEPVVSKNRFGGFIGSGGRLERTLRDLGVDTVLVTGTVTNICCESTARESAMLDFKTVMVSDANGGRSEAEDIRTYATFLTAFGDVMTADEVVARFGGKVEDPARLHA